VDIVCKALLAERIAGCGRGEGICNGSRTYERYSSARNTGLGHSDDDTLCGSNIIR